jgi:hypothetical protein
MGLSGVLPDGVGIAYGAASPVVGESFWPIKATQVVSGVGTAVLLGLVAEVIVATVKRIRGKVVGRATNA